MKIFLKKTTEQKLEEFNNFLKDKLETSCLIRSNPHACKHFSVEEVLSRYPLSSILEKQKIIERNKLWELTFSIDVKNKGSAHVVIVAPSFDKLIKHTYEAFKEFFGKSKGAFIERL